ncbi:MAG: hypothetical protein ABIN36_14300 [Ferruginibacter sp.]
MKSFLICFLSMAIFTKVSAQLKATPQCPPMIVNIEDGSVNKMQPNAALGLIEKTFPCFTSIVTETDSSKCGGLISFSDKDIYFYTSRDYIEIGEKFNGKLSIPLLGAVRADLFKWLGYPKIKDITWDAFLTAYGVLVVYYDKAGKINKIQISTKSAETLKLCQ